MLVEADTAAIYLGNRFSVTAGLTGFFLTALSFGRTAIANPDLVRGIYGWVRVGVAFTVVSNPNFPEQMLDVQRRRRPPHSLLGPIG